MVRGVLRSMRDAMASPRPRPQPARTPVGACGHRARTRSKMRGAPRRRAERLTVLSAKHSSTLRQVLEYSAASTTSLSAACFSALPALRPSRHAPTTECEADASLPPGKRARPQATPAPPLLASARGMGRERKQFYNHKKMRGTGESRMPQLSPVPRIAFHRLTPRDGGRDASQPYKARQSTPLLEGSSK